MDVDEVGVRVLVLVTDRVDVKIFSEAAREGVTVLVLVPVGVGDEVLLEVRVPVKLLVLERDEVIDGEVPNEVLALGVGVCDPVMVFDGELVLEGVPVEDPVIEEVSVPLLETDGEAEDENDTLSDKEIDAPIEKVDVGDNVEVLLRLIEVEGVIDDVIVGDPVLVIVAVAEGV